jgi:uncharacterized protein
MLKKTNIKELVISILLFWVLAYGYSVLLNQLVPKSVSQVLYSGYNVFSYGWGPALSVLTLYIISKVKKGSFTIYSAFGTDKPWKSIAVFITPILALALVDLANIQKSLLIGTAYLVYCIGEEIGWRGWLLKNLQPYSQAIQVSVVWVAWLLWHLSFQPITITFALLLLAGVLGINLATRKTGSIVVASAMHAVINLIDYSPTSLLITIPIWVAIFWSWKREV